MKCSVKVFSDGLDIERRENSAIAKREYGGYGNLHWIEYGKGGLIL